jgi:hypothetical protein
MIRVRFEVNLDDPRPVNWPIKHPYWVSGESDTNAIIVAYADNKEYIYENWPKVKNIDIMQEDEKEYTFTDRFPKSKWFKEDTNEL